MPGCGPQIFFTLKSWRLRAFFLILPVQIPAGLLAVALLAGAPLAVRAPFQGRSWL